MADNVTDQPNSEKRIESKSASVEYDMPDLPLHACDYVNILSTPDKAFVLQFFSTTPPVIDDDDESPLAKARRRCIGQIHITPTVAERIMEGLTAQLSRLK